MPSDDIILRRARMADAPAIAELYIASRRGAAAYMPTVHTDDEIRGWVSSYLVPRLEVWVAESRGRIAGFIALEGEDMLDQLFVVPAMQRTGVGDRLLILAKQLRPARLRLYTFERNTPARHFYEARGFVAVDFNDGSRNEENEPDVLYQWTPHQ
jgi:GNAT superfamily N-acetyltransferase